MILEKIAEQTMKLLEDYSSGVQISTTDEDYRNKFFLAYNNVANEVAKVYGIKKKFTILGKDFNLNNLGIKNVVCIWKNAGDKKEIYHAWNIVGNDVILDNDGEYEVLADVYPEILTDENAEVPFPDHVANVIPYGICKALLTGTGESNTAAEFEKTYYAYLQEIPRSSGITKARVINVWQR